MYLRCSFVVGRRIMIVEKNSQGQATAVAGGTWPSCKRPNGPHHPTGNRNKQKYCWGTRAYNKYLLFCPPSRVATLVPGPLAGDNIIIIDFAHEQKSNNNKFGCGREFFLFHFLYFFNNEYTSSRACVYVW